MVTSRIIIHRGGKLIDGIDDAVCAMFLKLTGFGVPPTATQAIEPACDGAVDVGPTVADHQARSPASASNPMLSKQYRMT